MPIRFPNLNDHLNISEILTVETNSADLAQLFLVEDESFKQTKDALMRLASIENDNHSLENFENAFNQIRDKLNQDGPTTDMQMTLASFAVLPEYRLNFMNMDEYVLFLNGIFKRMRGTRKSTSAQIANDELAYLAMVAKTFVNGLSCPQCKEKLVNDRNEMKSAAALLLAIDIHFEFSSIPTCKSMVLASLALENGITPVQLYTFLKEHGRKRVPDLIKILSEMLIDREVMDGLLKVPELIKNLSCNELITVLESEIEDSDADSLIKRAEKFAPQKYSCGNFTYEKLMQLFEEDPGIEANPAAIEALI